MSKNNNQQAVWDDNTLIDAYNQTLSGFKELSNIWKAGDQCLVSHLDKDAVSQAMVISLHQDDRACTVEFLDLDPGSQESHQLEELCPVVNVDSMKKAQFCYRDDKTEDNEGDDHEEVDEDIDDSDETSEDEDGIGRDFKHYQDGVSILFNDSLFEAVISRGTKRKLENE